MKVWDLQKEDNTPLSRWKSTLKDDLNYHRTRVNEMVVGQGYIWTGRQNLLPLFLISHLRTASTDDTVQIHAYPAPLDSAKAREIKPINHPTAVKTLLPLQLSPLEEPYLITGAGDIIRTYELSSLDSPPELLSTVDAHWHDVTILKLWMRLSEEGKVTRTEPWIVSASLDGTIRRWRLAG